MTWGNRRMVAIRGGIPRWVSAVIASLFLVACASAAPTPLARRPTAPTARRAESNSARLATWIWKSETILDNEQCGAFLAFARERRVDTVYLQYSPKYEDIAGFEHFSTFMRLAYSSGIQVMFVAGDPKWALSNQHAGALRIIDRTAQLNRRLRAEKVPGVEGVQYDIEPYLLADWKARPGTVEPQFVALLAKLHQVSRREQLALWFTLPFWFEHHPFDKTTLDRAAFPYADGIVIMAYRDSVPRVLRAVQGVIAHALAAECPIVVAIETACNQPTGIAFCGSSQRELEQGLDALRDGMSGDPWFAGLAVHHYASWRALRPGMDQDTQP